MTTGQAALYSICISHTENNSFGGSHEHLFFAGREEIPMVFLFAGGVRHLHADHAGPELQPFLCAAREHAFRFLASGSYGKLQRAGRHSRAPSADRASSNIDDTIVFP